MGLLLLLVCTGTPRSTSDCNRLELFTSLIIKGTFQKMIEKGFRTENVAMATKKLFSCSSHVES